MIPAGPGPDQSQLATQLLIAQGIIATLELISLLAAAFLIYCGGLVLAEEKSRSHGKGKEKNRWSFARIARFFPSLIWPPLEKPPTNVSRISRGLLLFALIAGFLLWTRGQTRLGLVDATAALLWGMLICGAYYFVAVRRDWPDDRIRYTILLWTAFWLFISGLLALLAWTSPHVTFKTDKITGEAFSQYVNTFAQIAGIIIAATMVVVSNRHNAKEADETARQQIYQSLELESIKLFRFECNHTELVHLLWFTDAQVVAAIKRVSEADDDRDEEQDQEPNAPVEARIKNYQLKQYTCQILNLFEMACRFRKQGIIEPEVFGSWVIWMWELCSEPMFQLQWQAKKDGIEYNYVADLREIINAGIYYATKDLPPGVQESGRKRSFYKFVAHAMFTTSEEEQRKLVQTWLDDSAPNVSQLERLRQRHAAFDEFWFSENNAAEDRPPDPHS